MSENVYDRALAVLDEYGWHQGDLGSNEEGYCAVGAICAVAANTWEVGNAVEKLKSHLPEGVVAENGPWGKGAVATYNDDPSTTAEDIKLLFKQASAAHESKGTNND